MRLLESLQENKATILDKWINKVLATYPNDTSLFFKKQKDQFANPVGFSVTRCLTELYEALFTEQDFEAIPAILDQLVRIRAVQEFSPSRAVSFVYMLKESIREVCEKEGELAGLDIKEWLALEDRIDAVAHVAFDHYMACREQLFKVRINELKSGRSILTDEARCPSALMKKKQETELEKINIHSLT